MLATIRVEPELDGATYHISEPRRFDEDGRAEERAQITAKFDDVVFYFNAGDARRLAEWLTNIAKEAEQIEVKKVREAMASAAIRKAAP